MQRKKILIVGVVATLLLGGFFLLRLSQKEKNIPTPSLVASSTEVIATTTATVATSTVATRGRCLEEGEVAEYEKKRLSDGLQITINIKEKKQTQ